jgi:hypothetical protein
MIRSVAAMSTNDCLIRSLPLYYTASEPLSLAVKHYYIIGTLLVRTHVEIW